MANQIPYQSFCWSLGTTSFRTRYFNKTIEEQLSLLDQFWALEENREERWEGNNNLQSRYYDFMRDREFVEGDAGNKPKDAREKTSGLTDIGLIDGGRRLTQAGRALLEISRSGDFTPDGFFQIPRDSFLYLKQLLKTHNVVDGNVVRPFLVLLHLLAEMDYLTLEEFTYLLPLCTDRRWTEQIITGIRALRQGKTTVDEIILDRLMGMDNYRDGLILLLAWPVDEDLLCQVGMNRKSRSYDRAYYPLYQSLYRVYVEGDLSAASEVFAATKRIKIGRLWRSYLFNTASEKAVQKRPAACLKRNMLDGAAGEQEFKTAFYRLMHLLKAKATLSDYLDLNRRYIRTTDVVLFEDGRVRLDVVPKQFFLRADGQLYRMAYQPSELLFQNCPMEEISPCLVADETSVIQGVNRELGTSVSTMEEARAALEDQRYQRLWRLIDAKFTDQALMTLLDHFAAREDGEIRKMVTDDADIPTIFEYVLGILWYKVSERKGKILDYMKLSLDADLLPKTHAAGGEADIVYEYQETADYPAHTLLLEATLADRTNQRRMELEPVSRHLGQHLLRTGNPDSYCVFATNYLDINVLSDFRGRKGMPYYDPQDYDRCVNGMKIIPLQTGELKRIVGAGLRYRELYPLMESAFQADLPPHRWYQSCIVDALEKRIKEG